MDVYLKTFVIRPLFFFFEKTNIKFFLYCESPKNDFIVIIKLSYPSFLNFLINISVDKIRLMASSFHMILGNLLKKVRMISYIIQKRIYFILFYFFIYISNFLLICQ